jgi:hypothetical protein
LEQTFRQAGEDAPPPAATQFLSGWEVDWAGFRAEYPSIEGNAGDWLERLRMALRPTFGESGNPHEPPSASLPDPAPSWFTSGVIALAKWIDETQTFDQLPILADALEDSGCTEAELLGHLRARGLHSRGCGAIDLILANRILPSS